MSDNIKCPICKSSHIHSDKKGFSGKKAVAGAVLVGGVGILAGTIGSNKIKLTCLSCGCEFKPSSKPVQEEASMKVQLIAGIVVVLLFLTLLYTCS